MKTLKLWRGKSTPLGTQGTLTENGVTICYTYELPWKNNQNRVSCIPEGLYKVTRHGWEENTKVERKKTWHVQNVPNREAILIHAGNTMKDTKGCILVGMMPAPSGVTRSQEALALLRKKLPETFFLEIETK